MNGVEDKITRKIYILIGIALCFTAVIMYRVEADIQSIENYEVESSRNKNQNSLYVDENNENLINQNILDENIAFDESLNDQGNDSWEINNEIGKNIEDELSVEIEKIDISDYTDETYWNVILVNKKNTLPKDRPITLGTISNGKQLDHRIVDITNQMLNDAKAAGVSLIPCSTYRSYSYQQRLFDREFNDWKRIGYSDEDAKIAASREVAYPGTSEHQLGLAIDFLTNKYMILDQGFENTDAFKWLNENAHNYGYILRYMKGKEDKTGIMYEPWHWRYLGVELAKEVKNSGLCYEEFLGKE